MVKNRISKIYQGAVPLLIKKQIPGLIPESAFTPIYNSPGCLFTLSPQWLICVKTGSPRHDHPRINQLIGNVKSEHTLIVA